MDYIGVIDSGIGGLSVLKECANLLKKQNFVYIADLKNAPYGNKNARAIQHAIEKNIYYLLEHYNIKALIVACNTATSCCVKQLRKKFILPIIGVEPAIRLAIMDNSQPILVLMTKATYKHNELVQLYKRDKDVKCLALKHLAQNIDNNLFSLNRVKIGLHKYKKYKNIVLGCTHYCFIKEYLKTNGQKIFDSNKSIATKVKEVKERVGITDCNHKKREIKILSSLDYIVDERLVKFFNTF